MNTDGYFAPLPGGGAEPQPLGEVKANPGRITGIGAYCELGSRGDDRTQSFDISEFLMTEAGERIWLHRERGFTTSLSHTTVDTETVLASMSIDDLKHDVLTVVLPDDEDSFDDHPWEWLAELARNRGVAVDAEELKRLPYEVAFDSAVMNWLSDAT